MVILRPSMVNLVFDDKIQKEKVYIRFNLFWQEPVCHLQIADEIQDIKFGNQKSVYKHIILM